MKRGKYRAVVIGSGRIGALLEAEKLRTKPASHAGAIVANTQTQLAAFVDSDVHALARAKKIFPQAAIYRSVQACLAREKPDIVLIATPPLARLELIRQCIEAHVKMIICEKPLAQNVREALAIKKLLDTSKTVFVLNYQRRFSPLFAGMRRDIQTGKLGRIQQVSCYYSNGLYNNGGHAIDALSYLLDDSIVTARGLKNEHNRTYYNDDFNIDGILETKKGTRISMQSLDQHAYGIHDIHIFGEKGDILISAYGQTAVRRSARPSMFAGIQQLDSKTEKVVSRPLSATKDALVHAIDCYEHKKKPKSGIENGVDTMRILDALARSARSGGKRILL